MNELQNFCKIKINLQIGAFIIVAVGLKFGFSKMKRILYYALAGLLPNRICSTPFFSFVILHNINVCRKFSINVNSLIFSITKAIVQYAL